MLTVETPHLSCLRALLSSHADALPALDMPLAALVQASTYFLHPEAAAPVALAACLLIVRALAFPMPTIGMLRPSASLKRCCWWAWPTPVKYLRG